MKNTNEHSMKMCWAVMVIYYYNYYFSVSLRNNMEERGSIPKSRNDFTISAYVIVLIPLEIKIVSLTHIQQ